MAKNMTPAQFAAKWAARAAAATDAIKAGVNAVSESPMEKAAAAKDKYLQGVQQAAAEGKYERGLRRVSLQSWKDKVNGKGIQNYQTGVREATQDMQTFAAQLLPVTKSISDQIKQMPSTTQEERKQRMLKNFELMSQFKRT